MNPATAATANPLPYSFARQHHLLLELYSESAARLWVSPATSRQAWAEVFRHFDALIIEVHPTSDDNLTTRIQAAYSDDTASPNNAATVIFETESTADLSRMMQELPTTQDLLETSNDAPIIRMLNALLTQAARDGASDIHIEPYEKYSSVRLRIDGALSELVRPNRGLHAALISRLKIMAELDIAEKRLPQDGRIGLRMGSKSVDVRVSTIPSIHGERAVLRLLDKSQALIDLNNVGLSDALLRDIQQLLAQPHGLFLVTGPTGSGKTTTLYAALQHLSAERANIMTVEDPIEYELAGIAQTQTSAKIGLDFASALRAILRQDPDIIMIGEIRDAETARIAIQASLTGHLVLATLHTNDAISTVTRLVDMGVEPFLLSSSLLGVVAQRLVRKVCPSCQGAGCQACRTTGYKGRVGIFELLVCDAAVSSAIHDDKPELLLGAAASAQGMRTMREYGQALVAQGVTTSAELARVAKEE